MSNMVSVSAERNAQQLKLRHPKMFTDICYSHAGRLLRITDRRRIVNMLGDIQGSAVDSISGAPTTFANKFQKGRHLLNHRVFGSPLDIGIVECFVPVIKFLHSSDCLNTEGLFRKSGNCSRVKVMRESLNRCDDIARTLAVGSFNAHDCASILKTFLAELPEPLLSEQHFPVHSLAADLPAEQHLQLLQILVHLLPPASVLLLKHLLGLLRRVCEQKETRMTATSLGILFAPHLVIPRAMPASEMASVLPRAGHVVAVMISRSAVLFRLPDTILREMERQFALLDGAAGHLHSPRRVERRCAMKRTRVKTEPGVLKPVQVSFTSRPSLVRSLADKRIPHTDDQWLPHGDKAKVVKESSHVIIVDVLPDCSAQSDNDATAQCMEPMSTYHCPRTGHYSRSQQRQQYRPRTTRSAHRYQPPVTSA